MQATLPAMPSTDLERTMIRTRALDAFARGDFMEAYRLGEPLLTQMQRDASLLRVVAISASKLRRTAEGKRLLRRLLKRQPRDIDALVALAECHQLDADLDEALDTYQRVLQLAPNAPHAIAGKASVLERRGDTDGARALLRRWIDAGQEDAYSAMVFVRAEQSDGRFAESIALILKHLRSPATPLGVRKTLCELAAKAYEKLGEFDRAFEAFSLSNELIAKPFNPKAFEAEIDTLIGIFSRQNLRTLPRSGDRAELPVFVASLPRSGSTLCEQIIHAHSKAFGAGEIVDFERLLHDLPQRLDSIQRYPACLGDLTRTNAAACGRWYLSHLRRYAAGAERIVNKHLDNWRHLGLISLLLPGARVIHATRDPMDNGFSIYMAAMNTNVYPWSTDLGHIGFVYRQYERLTDHWREVLDVPMLDAPYESVVAEPEAWIRRIIEFVGLGWDERCLRFHEAKRDVHTLSYDQVRRPIYRSAVKRYEKYEEHLGPLRAALGAS